MLAKLATVCLALLSVGRACEDDKFTPLGTAKTSVKWTRDGFKLSIFGNPDKYIPHSMYIGKYREILETYVISIVFVTSLFWTKRRDTLLI